LAGGAALEEIAQAAEVQCVMAAIVGAAGLRSTLAAARAGKRLLLANKEALVMAGPLLIAEVKRSGATLLPIDSEHNAIFQCLLFGLTPAQVQVLVHPQSIVHSLVEFLDGSVLAQLSSPDMRTPIAHALAWPERIGSGVQFLDLLAVGRLEFRAPDTARFPCLALAQAAARAG